MKTIKVFSFSELQPCARQKAITDFKPSIVNFNFDVFGEDIKNELVENEKIIAKDVFFSLNNCQGDGLCFTCDNIIRLSNLESGKDLNVFEKEIVKCLSKEEINILIEYLEINEINIIHDNSNYYHCYTCCVDYELTFTDVDILLDKVEEIIKSIFVDVCYKYEKQGYECYDVTDEEVDEWLDVNDYLFFEDGTMYKGE